MIRQILKTAQSRQKSYVDVRQRYLDFKVNDWVFLKMSPMKGVMRFEKKEKLSSCYIGPYQIIRRIGNGAYELDLPASLDSIHLVLYVSMFKKFVGDPFLMVPIEDIGVMDSLFYVKVSVEILDRQVHRLRTKDVA